VSAPIVQCLRCLAAVSLVLVVAACGGGSSDSDTGGVGDSKSADNKRGVLSENGLVRFDSALSVGPEGQTLTLHGAFPAPESIEIAASPDVGVVLAGFRENSVSLSLPQVDRPTNVALTLALQYPGQSATVNLNVVIQNTSAAIIEEQVENTLAERDSILQLTQDAVLYQFFLQMAYLNGELTHSQLHSALEGFKPENGPWAFDTAFALDNLLQTQQQYRQGRVSEQVLKRELDYAVQMIANHGSYGREMLKGINQHVEVIVPGGLLAGGLAYVSSAGLYSRILSSPRYVQNTQQGIRLNSEYAAIESLVRFSANQKICCEVM